MPINFLVFLHKDLSLTCIYLCRAERLHLDKRAGGLTTHDSEGGTEHSHVPEVEGCLEQPVHPEAQRAK